MRGIKIFGILFGLATAISVAALSAPARHDEDDDPKAGKAMPVRGTTFRIELGLKDSEATGWGGTIKLSDGTITALRATGGAESAEGNSWKAKSTVAKKKKKAGVTPVQVFATIDAPPATTVSVTTPQGEFSFKLGDIAPNKPAMFLDGQARVGRGPLSVPIVTADTDDDFPAAAVAPDGTVWAAYVAYKHGNSIELPKDASIPKDWSSLVTKGNGDQVKLIKFDGKTWSKPIDVTEPGLDVWRPSVAVEGSGQVRVVWSQNFDGNWELGSRRFDPKTNKWDRSWRLPQGGADINSAMTTDSTGRVWLAYQAWHDNPKPQSFNILVLRQAETPTGWSEPIAVAASTANEWSPRIAADSKGNVFVAYDTYEKGNYDVRVAVLSAGNMRPSRTIAIADSPRFEARPSVAVDKEDRVWVAYEEADPNWGKDFGSRWKGKSGVPFYVERHVRVRVVENGEVKQPKGDIPAGRVDTDMLTGKGVEGNGVRLSFPRLATDAAGRVWLLYRRHALATGAGELWSSFATHHDGDRWSPEITLPNSENLMDNRPAVVPLGDRGVLAIYSTDKRVNNTATARDNDIFVSVLGSDTAAKPSELAAVAPPPDGEKDDPVHPNESEDVKRMRDFRVKAGGKTYQPLRGEFHRHTEMTAHRDQDGPFEEIWRYGLDVARMDWIGPGDHDNGNREYTWWLSQKQIDMYHHAPTFMPMFTYERSVVYPSGHRNVVFAKRGIRPLPRLGAGQDELLMGTPEGGSPDVKRFYAYLKHFGGICSSHTSATNMGTDWRDNDPEAEPVVEIYQGHRQNYEHKGAPQSAKDAADSIGQYQEAGYVWNAWQKGYRLGIQVSSDHVSTHLSYAVVLAESPTREAIVDAFKKRHTYGAQDNIVLAVKSGEHLMGDEFATKSPPEFEIHAIGTSPIARVAIVRGVGKEVPTYVYNAEPKKSEVKLTWKDDMAVAGETSYYYVRIEQADSKLAWASPMWIKYEK